MKKKLLSGILVASLLCSSVGFAFAQEPPAPNPQTHRFEIVKSRILHRLQRRKNHLQRLIGCVRSANDFKQLRLCRMQHPNFRHRPPSP